MTMTPQREKIAARQRELQAAGFYDGAIDGIAGRLTKQAEREYQQMLEDAHQPISINNPRPYHKQIAWGKKVTQLFKEKVLWIVDDLKWPEQAADWLMACMAFESGESFRSDIRNGAGSGAVGLIQFMPSTASALGVDVPTLAKMSPEAQLFYVHKYFKPYKGRINSLSDLYMAILWPVGVGKTDSYILWDKKTKPVTYRQNSGLDVNKDLVITKGEAAKKVSEKLARGLLDENKG